MAKAKAGDNIEAAMASAPASWGADKDEPETVPAVPASRVINPDIVHARGRKWLDEVKALFFDAYPAFRPSYAEVTLLFACVYSVSVKHDISPGQAKSLELLRKKLFAKGIVASAQPPSRR